MTTETATALRLVRTIRADRETVFRAWTDPEAMKEWYCPEGGTVDRAESDPVVGGRFTVAMAMPNGMHVVRGVYREVERPSRLVFTWRWEGGEDLKEGETLVTVELEKRGDTTELVLTHEGFPTAESRDGHREGWTSALNHLEASLRS